MSRLRNLTVVVIALIAALLLTACGDSGGDEDPAEVLQATFSNQEAVNSGTFDVSVELTSEGGEDAGTFKASLGGPFQGAEGEFPSFDIDAEAELESAAQDFSGSAGLISTGDAAYVNFQDTEYEVPQQAFDQFASTFNRLQAQTEKQASGQNGNFLASIGIDPTNWLTDLSNDGTEDVEGTETIHISGEADTPKLIEDIKKIAENAPQAAQQLTPQQLGEFDQLTGIIESAELDVFTGKDDDILRKLEADLKLNPPSADGAPSEVTLKFTITLGELNEPQEISAPADAVPLQGLLDQLGVDAGSLGQLGGALGGTGASQGAAGGGAPPAADTQPAPSNDPTQAYLECLQTASGEAALQQCAELLQ